MRKGAIILDPMCGSGTTLRAALDQGLVPVGSDLDPLAVLISKVNTTPLDAALCEQAAKYVIIQAQRVHSDKVKLPWIDGDNETASFIDFWFAPQQINQLRRIVYVINELYAEQESMANFLKVALSRIIITKEMKASLARDTSHSRPHRVARTNSFDCYQGYLSSARQLAKRLPHEPVPHTANIVLSDARNLFYVDSESIDAVITSPPYLNAIDYMRGNKMSLVWLGYKIKDLKEIRSTNIGAEKRAPEQNNTSYLAMAIADMDFYRLLDHRQRGMFDKYILDILAMMRELSRVLKKGGKAIIVVGNSCLKEVFIKNTEAVIAAANTCGLVLNTDETRERRIPDNRRYLPINKSIPLAKRMRTETILSFTK
jgi:DNA modification methylase